MTDAPLMTVKAYDAHGYVVLRSAIKERFRHVVGLCERGEYPYHRPSPDLYPYNVAKIDYPCHPAIYQAALTVEIERVLLPIVKAILRGPVYVTHSELTATTRYPFEGLWHRDATVGDDTSVRAMVCLEGRDDFEVMKAWGAYRPVLCPGDVIVFHSALMHRGRCLTHRLTWLLAFSTVMDALPVRPTPPTQSLTRTVKRIYRTAQWYMEEVRT